MSNPKKKIAVVDDHAMFRKGLCMLINLFAEYAVQFDAENGQDFIEKIDENNLPDIALLDINMPVMDGYATAQWLKNKYPTVKILALSTMDSDTAIINMLKSGAKGYVLKDADPEELKQAFDETLSKGFFYNEMVTKMIVQSLTPEAARRAVAAKFSEREIEFIKLACSDKPYKQIAEAMHLSDRTIDGYRDSIFKKINVTTRVGMALYAIKNGIVAV